MKEIELKIPKKYCVYFLKDKNNDIVYVGISKENSLMMRISAHVYNKKFEKVTFIECENQKESEMMECKMIIKYNPIYNNCITNPKSIGYIGKSELIKKAKELYGYKPSETLRKIRNRNIETIEFNLYIYYKKDAIEKIK